MSEIIKLQVKKAIKAKREKVFLILKPSKFGITRLPYLCRTLVEYELVP
ncbi:MAG: hypothetical protein ACREOW_14380 [Thermodesulfobacteriota bacterium]